MAEEDDLASRETCSDDGDDDLDDESMQGALVASEPAGGETRKKDKAKVPAGPKVTKKRKKRKMKPKDYPKRPLSAYNIFFKQTREKNLGEHGKLNFQEMVKKVASQWKEISPEDKTMYQDLAGEDLARYKKAVGVYERDMLEKNRLEREEASKARKKFLAEEEQKAKHAKKDSAKRSPAFSSSLPSANGVAGGGWEERGNPYFSQSSRMPMGDGPYSSDRPLLHHRNGMPGTGMGSADLTAAHARFQDELRSMEEARAIHLRRLELAQASGISRAAAAAALKTSGRGGMPGTLDLPTAAELELKQHQARYLSAAGIVPLGGGDALAAAKDADLRERLSLIRDPSVAAEHEARLLQEARMAVFGHSGFSAGAASVSPYSSLFPPMATSNPYEEALMREQMLRRQELLLRAGMGAGGVGSLYGTPGSTLHSALRGGVGAGLGGFGGAQPFADLGYSGAAGAGLASLGAFDPQSRLGMGLAAEERLATLGRVSDEEILRTLSRQAPANSLVYPPAGESHRKRIDATD
jgi:HMG (high mobility group) box